ncbi:MAG: hypothetical protein ACTSRS_10010 [Candidatus Helarchaeota archaeon]
MTVFNVGVNEKTKKLREVVKLSEYKTVSELVRSTFNEKLTIEKHRKT